MYGFHEEHLAYSGYYSLAIAEEVADSDLGIRFERFH